MKKFLLLYTSPPESMGQMANATEEQKMEAMKPWLTWNEEMGDALVDFGAPMMGAEVATTPDNWQTHQCKHSGYSIIQAENMEAAKKSLKNHPHLKGDPNHTVKIYELISM